MKDEGGQKWPQKEMEMAQQTGMPNRWDERQESYPMFNN